MNKFTKHLKKLNHESFFNLQKKLCLQIELPRFILF